MMLVCFFDGCYIRNSIQNKYERWKMLKSVVVSGNQRANNIVIWTSLCIVMRAMYMCLLQQVNKTIKKIGKNKYEISYTINGKIYKNIVCVSKGPSKILQVCNDKQEDITSHVLPYIGPGYDCHGNKIVSSFFNSESLTFELSDGSEITISGDDEIPIFE